MECFRANGEPGTGRSEVRLTLGKMERAGAPMAFCSVFLMSSECKGWSGHGSRIGEAAAGGPTYLAASEDKENSGPTSKISFCRTENSDESEGQESTSTLKDGALTPEAKGFRAHRLGPNWALPLRRG